MKQSYAVLYAAVQADRGASYWLKRAASDLQDRDPVDALADAEHLVVLARAKLASLCPACGSVKPRGQSCGCFDNASQ